jgi:hypothetical protein
MISGCRRTRAKCRASCRTKPQLVVAQANDDIRSGKKPGPVVAGKQTQAKPHQTFVADTLAIPEMTGLVVVHEVREAMQPVSQQPWNILASTPEKILIIAWPC